MSEAADRYNTTRGYWIRCTLPSKDLDLMRAWYLCSGSVARLVTTLPKRTTGGTRLLTPTSNTPDHAAYEESVWR